MHLQQGGGNPRHPPVGASSHINFIAMSYTMSTTPICYLISFGLSILVVCPASRHHACPFYTDVAIVQFVPYSLYLLSAIFLVVTFFVNENLPSHRSDLLIHEVTKQFKYSSMALGYDVGALSNHSVVNRELIDCCGNKAYRCVYTSYWQFSV